MARIEVDSSNQIFRFDSKSIREWKVEIRFDDNISAY